MLPETVRAAHIVRHAQGTVIELHEATEAMQGVLAQIRGGTPFETLARQYSDCPDDGGDLGYFPRGAMVPEFEEVVFQLEPGEMSGVFSDAVRGAHRQGLRPAVGTAPGLRRGEGRGEDVPCAMNRKTRRLTPIPLSCAKRP